MAKKHRDARVVHAQPAPVSAPDRGISRRGWKVIGAGIVCLAAGYVVLCFTDPRGQNWASTLSPFMILGGYATIGVGIMTPDPDEQAVER